MAVQQRTRIWTKSMSAAVLALGVGIGAVGCAPKGPRRIPPRTIVAPYDTSVGEVLWGVVPLRNESGTTAVDTLAVTDEIVAAAEQVQGVRAVPLNRTIAAMRSLGLADLSTPEEVRLLASEMGVDGLIVGSVTAWDPYDPPTLGLALALYARGGRLDRRGQTELDTRTLTYQPTDYTYFPGSSFTEGPASVASELLDGKNHQVLMDLDRYVAGRNDPSGMLGTRRFLASMELYTEFGAWRLVGRLVEHEWLRLARVRRE
jgi:hypothetical protein